MHSTRFEPVLVEDAKSWSPTFEISEIAFVDEIKVNRGEQRICFFEIHLKEGIGTRVFFHNLEDAVYLYEVLFNFLSGQRYGFMPRMLEKFMSNFQYIC
ncbi:MAG: hypothetical protein GY866_24765 [Proteobacteria bacterium]|nr:hypothetical protein [Pseudomonadota bacterium]